MVLSPIAMPSWRMLRERSPQLQEYEYLQRAIQLLPERVVFVELRAHEPMPAYRMPDHVLRAARKAWRFSIDDVPPADRQGPLYFLAGIQCRAYSAVEL